MLEASQIGFFLTGYLIDQILTGKDNAEKTNAASLLVQLGPQVVVPVTEALRSNDDVLEQMLCDVLRKIRPLDARALPQLKRIYDDEKRLPAVRGWAKRALEEITGCKVEQLPSAEDFFYAEANRLLLGGPVVADQLADLRRSLWVWDKNGGENHGFLKYLELPSFAMDDVMAQDLIYQGLTLAKDPHRFQVLLAYSLLLQGREIQDLSAVLGLQGVTMPGLEAEQKEITDWKAQLYRNERIAWSTGSDMLMDVLDKAVLDGNASVVIAATEALENTGGAHGWDAIAAWKPTLAAAPQAAAETKKETPAAPAPEAVKAEPTEAKAPAVETAETKPEDEAKPAPTDSVEGQNHPLLAALDHPDPRIRNFSANCLERIGLPCTHPRYKQLLPVLVDGVREKASMVVLIVSNNPKVRERLSRILEEKGMVALTAATGRDGYNLALQYPPKDAIILDSLVEEFAYLQQRLALHKFIDGSELPLVVVTSRAYIESITLQFPEEQWNVRVMYNRKADDNELYDAVKLQGVAEQAGRRTVVLLTNEDKAERIRIKQKLVLEAERRGRPTRQSELLRLMRDKQLLSDIFDSSSMFVNVFVDDELAGYNAMHTLQTLRQDERTRPVPVALLVDRERLKSVGDEFERFLKDKADARIFDYEIGAIELDEDVKDMLTLNKLSAQNYVRKAYDRISLRSAQALNDMNVRDTGLAFDGQQAKWLEDVLRDTSRPVELRTAVAKALGHFKAPVELVGRALIGEYENKEANENLRAECMDALGWIDAKNEFYKEKLAAMGDASLKVQAAAARALNRATDKKIIDTLIELRPNDPQKWLTAPVGSGAAPAAAGDDAAPAGDDTGAAPAGGEEKKEGEENKEGGEKKEGGEELQW